MSQETLQDSGARRRRLIILVTVLALMGLQVFVAMVALTGCERKAPQGAGTMAGSTSGVPATGAPTSGSGEPAPVDPGQGGTATPVAGNAANDQAANSPRIDAKPLPEAPVGPPASRRAEDTAPLRRALVPQGTTLTLDLETRLGTKTSQVGDAFDATVASPVSVDGRAVVPAGARVAGRVILCEQPGKASGRGRMQLAFDKLTFAGHTYEIGSRSAIFESRSGAKKDREVVGGGAAAGAVVGGILGGSLGSAAKGAVIGGAAGAGVALATRGPQLEFAPGTKIRFSLDQPVEVRVTPAS